MPGNEVIMMMALARSSTQAVRHNICDNTNIVCIYQCEYTLNCILHGYMLCEGTVYMFLLLPFTYVIFYVYVRALFARDGT